MKPVRARIINVDGQRVGGFILKTPEVSRPHVGKSGIAEEIGNQVRITLDDGNVLWGNQCWWAALDEGAEDV